SPTTPFCAGCVRGWFGAPSLRRLETKRDGLSPMNGSPTFASGTLKNDGEKEGRRRRPRRRREARNEAIEPDRRRKRFWASRWYGRGRAPVYSRRVRGRSRRNYADI